MFEECRPNVVESTERGINAVNAGAMSDVFESTKSGASSDVDESTGSFFFDVVKVGVALWVGGIL
jgi:hypothetical protein